MQLARIALVAALSISCACPATGVAARAGGARCAAIVAPHGTVTIGSDQFPDTLNPFGAYTAAAGMLISAMQDDLFRRNVTGQLTAMMATRVPTLANGDMRDGGTTIVVHLKDGLRWSNGEPVTSADVLFGWQVAMDPVTGPRCLHLCDRITAVDTPDPLTAILHLTAPYGPVLGEDMPPLWPHQWPAWGEDPHLAALRLTVDPNFTFEGPGFPTDGPYMVERFVPGARIVLGPMPFYRDMTCGARLKRLVLVYDRGKPYLMTAASAGRFDVSAGYSAIDLPLLRDAAPTFATSVWAAPGLTHLEFNLDPTVSGATNPVADLHVRLALSLALDRTALLRRSLPVTASDARKLQASGVWRGPGEPTGQWDPIAGADVVPGSSRAVADARTLMAASPWKAGFAITLVTGPETAMTGMQVATVRAAWAALGVTVAAHFVPTASLLAPASAGGPLATGSFGVTLLTSPASADPDGWRTRLSSASSARADASPGMENLNYSNVRDPLIDAAFSAAATVVDPAVRKAQYAGILQRVDNQAYWIPLYHRAEIETHTRRVLDFRGIAEIWRWHVQGSG